MKPPSNCPLPLILLQDYFKKHPNIWKIYDSMFHERDKLGLKNWPDWMFLPMFFTAHLFTDRDLRNIDDEISDKITILGALSAWRPTQGIYQFDKELAISLSDTHLETLPVEILYKLPEWCVYIHNPFNFSCNDYTLDGFFVHFDCQPDLTNAALRIVFINTNKKISSIQLDLSQSSLELSILSAIHLNNENSDHFGLPYKFDNIDELKNEINQMIVPYINLILYLCSTNADFGDTKSSERPVQIRTKKGFRFFPPNKPRVWEVGFRIGSALRQAQISSEQISGQSISDRHSPRPHIRRAHWHTYLTGAGRSERILKWLPPIPINLDNGDIVPTIRKVQ
jgi:hypothetical protein